MWWSVVVAVCIVMSPSGARAAGDCALGPRGDAPQPKSPGDNYYRLLINGDIERYAPGQRYVVKLVGSRTHSSLQQFSRFQLWAGPLDPSGGRGRGRGRAQGEFQLFADTLARFDPTCVNSVVEADDLPKTEVQVMWKAPPAGSGCVLLKAMVEESSGRWYAEDGQLTRRLCEDTSVAASDCCACDVAKYTMVFEGIWSARTHPKDFPVQALWLTHFSDVIGATHVSNFSFWGEGHIATDGFRSLAEWGSVGLLERELRSLGPKVRSLVKAPGLWHPRLNENTTATFTVDRNRHLLSVASMFGPSPDWVVGVSGLELCQKDCSWAESKIVDLLPYDAGTDSGVTYMSANVETVPRERMSRITRMFPEDPRAPFYNPDGGAAEVPPLARLYLRRDSLTPKSCHEDLLQALVDEQPEDENEADKPECAVTEWSVWSACSVSCGKGLRMRSRQYAIPQKAAMFKCNRQLVSKEMCVADVPECEGDKTEEDTDGNLTPVEPSSGVCATSEWGAWSECSATCGIGMETRRRHFIDRMGLKKCPLVQIEENRKCMRPECPLEEAAEVADPNCPTTAWSAWSPCSASCGRGVRFRTRLLLVPAQLQQRCAETVQLLQQQPCADTLDCTLDMATAKRICMEEPEPGPCRGVYSRWAFIAAKGMCVPFSYGGCRGNRNNFLTQQDCLDTCAVVLGGGGGGGGGGSGSGGGAAVPPANIQPVSNTLTGGSGGADCVVGPWGEWSRCSVSCGIGYQQRQREIIREAGPGGAACPARLSRRRRCVRHC